MIAAAKRVCRACPVTRECRDYALAEGLDHGIWGGMTEDERREFRRTASVSGQG